MKVDPRASGDLDPPFTMLPEKDLNHQPLEDILLEVFDLTASFMEARRVPDHLMLAAYRKALGCVGRTCTQWGRLGGQGSSTAA